MFSSNKPSTLSNPFGQPSSQPNMFTESSENINMFQSNYTGSVFPNNNLKIGATVFSQNVDEDEEDGQDDGEDDELQES